MTKSCPLGLRLIASSMAAKSKSFEWVDQLAPAGCAVQFKSFQACFHAVLEPVSQRFYDGSAAQSAG
jgi:hypothetical protein